jgi:hypothetical protein
MRVPLFLATTFLAGPLLAAPQAGPSFDKEKLTYAVNWPSGLTLGEARLEARKSPPAEAGTPRWSLDFFLDAAVPGFAVADQFHSVTDDNGCSVEFEKNTLHGKKKAQERTTFDARKSTATRTTLNGGGKTEISVSACAHDALAFLYYLRRELLQGRMPPAQAVLLGAPYQFRAEYGGTRVLAIGESKIETDRLVGFAKGPASDLTFEAFFARDAVRTPVLIKVPLALGTFSMELVR